MLSKINRLKKNKEFNYIYKKGKYINSSNFSLHYVDTYFKFPKFGINVSKKVGNSVIRSRTKRVMSEVIRLNINKIINKNFVIVISSGFKDKSYQDIETEFLEIMKKNGLLKKEI